MTCAQKAIVHGLIGGLFLTTTRPAIAGWWVFESDDPDHAAGARVRVEPRLAFVVSHFDRPETACGINLDVIDFCPAANSDELGVGAGLQIMFRVAGPLHLTIEPEIVYSLTESSLLPNQWFMPIPIGVMLTVPSWRFRPIAAAHIVPLLFFTDDSRDYGFGGELGFATRISGFGDFSLLVDYHRSETLESVQVQLGFLELSAP